MRRRTHSENWPTRPLGAARPLLTAAEGFPALERAALAAQETAWLWFRVFDPDTPLTTPEARAAAGENWRDLLRHKLAQGVHVAVAIADFDAFGATDLHGATWRAARRLEGLAAEVERERATGLGGPPARLDCLVASHGSRAGIVWRLLAWPAALKRVERARRRFNAEAGLRLADHPGLAPYLTLRDGRAVWRAAPLPQLTPATHHQKIAVFDGAHAILGGLDLDARRWDTPAHARPPEQTWRDLSLALDGPIAADVARWLAALWNAERARRGRDDLRPLAPPPAPDAASAAPPSVRLSTTRSAAPSEDPAALAPRKVSRGLERDHLALIAGAERLLYIETQFLRSAAIVRALVRQARAAPDLGLILVLPGAPEAVAFDGADDMGRRFGEYLQARHVRAIGRAFGPRAAIVSPARPVAARRGDRAALAGAPIVYVHTKALIADDRRALVSSANLNGRSLRWDTEAGVALDAPEAVAALRARLADALLPEDAGAEARALATAAAAWRRIAAENAARAPADRRGFLLPHDSRPAEAFGAPAPGLPEEMV